MRFKAALIDLSGTLHIDGQAIPGAVAALERLRAAQLPCRFVTNTTKDTVDSLVMTLQTLGFGISKDEVFSSLSATRQLLKQRDLRPLLLLDRRALPEFDDVPQHDPNAVVVGLAREAFNYDSLNRQQPPSLPSTVDECLPRPVVSLWGRARLSLLWRWPQAGPPRWWGSRRPPSSRQRWTTSAWPRSTLS
uniref:Haloacid dehalogenase-like hydrolase domain-containing protein 2 n=1 Tax=Auxenochlorella protothecoides TaxID=3075 RepID=A0A1D2AC48_AUXPR